MSEINFVSLGGGGRVLQIFNPVIAQEVYRNEGKYPNRGNIFTCFKLLRFVKYFCHFNTSDYSGVEVLGDERTG